MTPTPWRTQRSGHAGHVQRWFHTHTFHSDQWDVERLLHLKGTHRISVVLPARNEQAKLGRIVRAVRQGLVDGVGLVDEVVVIDSRSTDVTARVAYDAGATVVAVDSVLASLGLRDGERRGAWTVHELVTCAAPHVRDVTPHSVIVATAGSGPGGRPHGPDRFRGSSSPPHIPSRRPGRGSPTHRSTRSRKPHRQGELT